MWTSIVLVWTVALVTTLVSGKNTSRSSEYPTKSGIKTWVDPETPNNRHMYTTSRGRQWQLVMSDEFNTANRSFRPGDDHMWTSLDKPDGVNGALEVYAHNMTGTKCDDDDTCYFYIETDSDNYTVSVYNMYKHPPGYQNSTFYYRAAMVQSWNKFCFQGGMLEVRAQLPGAVSKASGNPDLALGKNGKVTDTAYYPTWPGIWMMGNLGRAIFSASTNRMWPFSYDRCEPEIFDPINQRISACDDDPGYGLNANQGRGAPEIDLLEGGGVAISSSLQIAPGMPSDFRLFPADTKGVDKTNPYCVYSYNCETSGANLIDVPTSYYKKERGHKSWYQGLRYAANNNCAKKSANVQSFATVNASVTRGITENSCTTSTCPASLDVNGELGLIDGTGKNHWGINFNGTCFPIMNSYMGSYLCDPDNMDGRCASPRNSTTAKSNAMDPFNYQMDAISSNWPIHLGAYTDYLVYQLEWVTGQNGYVRWMLDGSPLLEVTADAFSNVPQNSNSSNPQKVMLAEPMSIIFNVALSSSWGTKPPNPGSACRGDGSDATVNKICDDFPMLMKIDYIRLYQDQGDDLDADNYMQVGCDPESHPTKEWIQGHIDEYQDNDNLVTEVIGKAFCKTNSDCTVGGNYAKTDLVTGTCVESRCSCTYPKSWGGPRCTVAQAESSSSQATTRVYGPPILLALVVAAVAVFLTFISVWRDMMSAAKRKEAAVKATMMAKSDPDARVGGDTTSVMLGIKSFIQESVQSLPPAQLRLLAEALRIDLRGCEDRGDIERVLTGLVCLDQDTSLGVFLAWLRSTDLQKNGILASKKPKFNNTFLPAISSSPEVHSSNQQSKPDVNENVKDHHLDDEIKQQLSELEVLEASFKKAERLLHTGSPSFEKLKQFLLELTILRAKEQTARAFLVRQANVLREQHGEMKAEMLHSRAQLDFFVEGFTNLRKRHDTLLADATRMKAENETAHEVFISMSAHDCYFEQLMRNTLVKQMQDNEEMKRQLQQANDDLDAAAEKRKELEAQISQLKQERGDARKDAYCYKRQLRVCKTRMRRLQLAGGGADGSFFRDQTLALRQTVAILLGLLRDAVVRDTKSPKQTLSKEALRILHQVVTLNVSSRDNESQFLSSFREEPESEEIDPAQTRVVHRQTSLDIDEVIKGVLLVEGATPTDAEECARIMGDKLKYLPVDLKQTLAQLQQDEENQAQAARDEEQRNLRLLLEQQQSQQSEGQGTDGRSDTSAAPRVLPAKISLQTPAQTNTPATGTEVRSQPTLEIYAGAVKKYISDLMAAQGKRGFVMYNWPFSTREVNLLTAMGLPVDSVINLEIVRSPSLSSTSTSAATPVASIPATPAKPNTPTTVKTATPSSSRAKAPVASPAVRGKASPNKLTTTSKSPTKPAIRTAVPSTTGAKSRAVSPKKAPTSPSKPKPPSVTSTSIKPGSSSSQLNSKVPEAPKIIKKVPTAASALQGLGGILQTVGPAAFPAERVNAILQVLEQQKRRKLAPVVQWDEATRRTNEMLAMWAEEVHMLVHLEQESRKPQKATTPTPAASPTKSTTTFPRRTASPSKITTSRTTAASKAKPVSPTRNSTKAKTTSTTTRPAKK